MAPAVTVQQSSDQGVIQRAAQKIDSSTPVEKVLKEPKTSVPVLLLVAGAAAALIWWNKRGSPRGKGSKGESSSRSRFAFPGGKGSTRAGIDAPASTLPRNKQGNNKKNKSRRREEKHRRAEKRDRALAQQDDKGKREDPDDPNNHVVMNYSYYDSGRRDYLHAPAQSQKKLTS